MKTCIGRASIAIIPRCPLQRHRKLYLRSSMLSRKRLDVRDIANAYVHSWSTNTHFHTDWSPETQGLSKSVRHHVQYATKHEINKTSAMSLSSDNFTSICSFLPIYISKNCNGIPDLVCPSLGLHARSRKPLKTYSRSLASRRELSSLCCMALKSTKAHSCCKSLVAIDVQGSGQRTRRVTTSADVHSIGAGSEQTKATNMTGDLLPAYCVYIGLGSNVGDCVGNIETACREMSNHGITVQKTSFLYQTKPMYLEEQQSFVNGVCEV